MTATLGFGWTYSDASNYVITEFLADGTSRTVSAQYVPYQEWLAAGNTPTQIAGNQYVTFPGGVPAYDSVAAAIAEVEAQWSGLISQITYQLNDTVWYMLSDSCLTAEQATVAAQWRKDLMAIPSRYPAIADAQARYTALMATKPAWEIKAPK
jgi:hypothetical protein